MVYQSYFLRMICIALGYACLANIVHRYFSSSDVIAIIWPSSGFALAVLLVYGKKYWPGIFVGAFFASIISTIPVTASFFIAAGGTLEALAGVWLLSRINNFDIKFTHPRDFFWLTVVAAMTACISMLIGVSALSLANRLPQQELVFSLLHWWQGDTLGTILLTPLILVWRQPPKGWFNQGRILETAIFFSLAFLVGQASFLGWFEKNSIITITAYWSFLFVAWGAVRFGIHGALLIIGMTAVQMLLKTMQIESGHHLPTEHLNFWSHMLTLTLIGVTLALTIERERKSATAEITGNEERLKIATDSGQVAIWEVNLQTNKLTWDDTCFALYKIKKEGFTGSFEEWAQRIHPDDLEKTVAAFQKAATDLSEYKPEFRIIWPDGQVRYIEGHGQLIKGEAGNPLRMIGTNWDITELKQAEMTARENEERLKLAVASGHIGTWEYNLQTRTLLWDDNMLSLYGVSRENFSGAYEAWTKYLHPEDLAKVEALRSDAINGIRDYESEFRIIRPNGKIRYIKALGQIIKNKAGEPTSIIGINWDNWAYSHSQHQLELAHTAINKSKTAFFWITEEGQVTDVNDYACLSLGYSHEELVGMNVWGFDSNYPHDVHKKTWNKIKKSGVSVLESSHTRKDGTSFPVEITANYLNLHGDERVFSSVQDISERKKSEKEREKLADIIERSVNEVLLFDAETLLFTYANEGARNNLGYTMDQLRTMSPADIKTEFSEASFRVMIQPLIDRKEELISFEGVHRRANGTEFPVEVQLQLANLDDEAQILAFVQDISERKAAEESMQLAASVYNNSSEAMTVSDANGIILTVNPAFTKITGYLPEEVIGKNRSMLSSGRHNEAFFEAMWSDINTTGHWQGEIWDRRKDGEVYPAWLTINTIFDENNHVHRRISLFSDSTVWKESEALIWHQANFDPLTQLPNRQMFHDRLDQDIKKAHRSNQSFTLMFLDLDRFKEVNDSLGHDIGDILLKEAAQRISSCVRETDTVARLGGDEFTIILDEFDDSSSADRIAQDILNKLSEPFHLKGELSYISASIGITIYPEDATDLDELIKNADQAMYEAKNQGRNRYAYFTQSMQEIAQFRRQMASDLRVALTDNQFWLAYQPIVELSTGIIHKAEALLRWQHPKLGLISPSQFIPITEHTGLIIDIGDWVFRQAANQVKYWQEQFQKKFQVSVNVSPVQFSDKSNKFEPWQKQLKDAGLDGKNIIVEITEGLLLEANRSTNEKLLEFRDAGIQVALDDFGTGYSSMFYLKEFDIDYIKIDQSFISGLAHESGDLALCEAMIVMAHKLDMLVIAEGVETTEQRDLLLGIGCDYAQGYLFSKPVPAKDFEKLLKEIPKI